MKFFLVVIALASALLLAASPWENLASLLPPLAAFVLVLVTRAAWLGLLTGGLCGAILLAGGHLREGMVRYMEDGIFAALEGPWHIGALLFTLLLGAFAAVLERSGGLAALFQGGAFEASPTARKKLQFSALGAGFVCFFDGLANSLLLGRVMKPLADRVGVSRVKLAYIADSTGSALACIAFISTWIASQLSYIQKGLENSSLSSAPAAYALFFQSIPVNFYCLFTLLLLLASLYWQWNPGPMKRFEESAASAFFQDEAVPSLPRSQAWRALLPLGVLAGGIVSLFYFWDQAQPFPVTLEKLREGFSGSAGPYALTVGSGLALLVASACLPGPDPWKQASEAAREGAAAFLSPLLILVLAWAFGNMLSGLGTAETLAAALGDRLPLAWFPALVFTLAACTSFFTGSSWGTMGLLMPLALGSLFAFGDTSEGELLALLPAVIGAVFGGAVFGDHCSPFSDTTIVSAIACGVEPMDHVRTQLPYALTAAGISLALGYGSMGLGGPAWLGLVLGSLVLVAIPWLAAKPKKGGEPSPTAPV
ncbi:MAG: Na+/H+ antiporter NhaC family protein [Verrucomicrobiota bacterium]